MQKDQVSKGAGCPFYSVSPQKSASLFFGKFEPIYRSPGKVFGLGDLVAEGTSIRIPNPYLEYSSSINFQQLKFNFIEG